MKDSALLLATRTSLPAVEQMRTYRQYKANENPGAFIATRTPPPVDAKLKGKNLDGALACVECQHIKRKRGH